MKVVFISFVCLFCIWGCTSHKTLEDLCDIDLYMSERPDSALCLLQGITTVENYTDEELAYYALLMSQALYINNCFCTLDSLIDIAVAYYGERDNIKNKARTFYYKGLICEEQNNLELALYYYKQVDMLIPDFQEQTAVVQHKYIFLEITSIIMIILLGSVVLVYQYKRVMGKCRLEQQLRENDATILELQYQFSCKLQNNSAIHIREITQLNDLLTEQMKKIKELELHSKQTSIVHKENLVYYQSALSGMHYYINILQNKDISQLDTKSLRCFIDCYKQIDWMFFKWLKKKDSKLTPREIVICIFIRMGKEKHEIINLLRCSDGSYRTIKNRIKRGLSFDNTNDVENCIKELR